MEKETDEIYSKNIFFKDANKYFINSEDKRKELIKAYKDGDKAALNELVMGSQLLVATTANCYKYPNIDFMDLIQEGNIGLIMAIKMFDLSYESTFATYANYWIKNYMNKFINKNISQIVYPKHINALVVSYKKITTLLEQSLGRKATANEIAEYMGITPKKVEEIQKYAFDSISFDDEITVFESPVTFKELFADTNSKSIDDQLVEKENVRVVKSILEVLNEKEKMVVFARYGFNNNEPRTLQSVADELFLSRERVRQIENEALLKLRKVCNKLNDFQKEKCLYDFFPRYSKEDILTAVTRLSPNQQKILFKKFDEQLRVKKETCNQNEKEIMFSVIPKIGYLLEHPCLIKKNYKNNKK